MFNEVKTNRETSKSVVMPPVWTTPRADGNKPLLVEKGEARKPSKSGSAVRAVSSSSKDYARKSKLER